MIWISDYLRSGLTAAQPSAAVCLYRILLATALLAKFWSEQRRYGVRLLRPDGFTAFLLSARPGRAAFVTRVYPVAYAVKWPAAGALLIGFLPQVACVLLVGWFAVVMTYERLNHTRFLTYCLALLALSPGLADCFTYRTVVALVSGDAGTVSAELLRRSDPFAQLLLVLLVSQMYLSTAILKMRSPEFRQGRVLHRFAEHMVLVRDLLPFREIWYPAVMVRHLVDGEHAVMARRWRPAAVATIALELALPVALLIPALWWLAVATGVAMHLAFTAILPVRLASFTIATTAAYVLFSSPLMH